MYGKYLVNWGATIGFSDSGIKAAVVTLRFSIEQPLNYVVDIPEGTRVTAGDNVFFATNEYVEIPIGETYVDVNATCTEYGSAGNGYAVGQITTVVDPIPYSPTVTNTVASDGGANEYSDDELKELLYLFPTTSSTAGPEDKYIILVKQYSNSIVDSKITTTDSAVVKVYIMLEDGEIPTEEYCENVLNYIKDSKVTPDTDKVEVLPPNVVHYTIDATYYISEDKKNVATTIQENVENAAEAFKQYTYSNIGIDINPDMLISYATVAGAKRIVITNPVYTVVNDSQIAVCDEVNLTYGGVEGN